MSFPFTDEQLRVLHTKGKNLIVSAQAGAGKTRVLVERILRHMEEEQVGLQEMLIVTFTKKAANEMKERIRKGLQERARTNEAQRTWLLEQLTEVSSANIQTLHAFCLEILQENFDHIGRDLGFRILGDRPLQELREEAMDEVLAEIYERRQAEELRFLETYGYRRRRSDVPMRELITRLYTEAEKKEHPRAWLQEQVDRLSDPQFAETVYVYWLQELFFPALWKMGECLVSLWRALQAPQTPPSLRETLMPEVVALSDWLRLPAPDETERAPFSGLETWASRWKKDAEAQAAWMRDHPVGPAFPRYPVLRKAQKEDPALVAWNEQIKGLRNRLKSSFQAGPQKATLSEWIRSVQRETVVEEHADMQASFRMLAEWTLAFQARFQQKKEEADGLDFSDVEHEMLRLLEKEEVRGQLQRRYRYLFFDEYQDASGLQDAIVEAIARPNNLFFVGDIKQSIYAFRQARPKNFLRRYAAYRQEAGSEALDLTKNFRSLPVPMHFCNFLFDALMTPERGDVHYASAEHRANPQRSAEPFPGQVHLCLLQEEKREENAAPSRFDDISSEPFFVAHTIQALVRAGGRYRDCAILFRTRHRIRDFEKVLQHFGIPVYSEQPSDVQDSTEVRLFLQLLHLVDQPQNDLALLACLSSGMGAVSDADLAKIRTAAPEGTFYEAVQQYRAQGEEVALRESLNDFFARLEALRVAARQRPLAEFGWTALQESGLYSEAAGLEEGRLRRAHLDAVLQRMEEAEEEGVGLYEFLNTLKMSAGESNDLPNAGALSEEDNVVRLMTIHKSKGLEFKNVFLVELGRKFNRQYEREVLLMHNEWGAALARRTLKDDRVIRGDSVLQRVVQEAIRTDERSEAVRVLYVACTRAEDRLYLVGHANQLEDLFLPEPIPLQEAFNQDDSYLKWLVHRLQYDAVAERSLRGELASVGRWFSLEDAYREWGIAQSGLLVELSEGATYRMTSLPEEALLTEGLPAPGDVPLSFDVSYPFEEDTRSPLKRTVSEIAKKNQILEEHFAPWPKLSRSGAALLTEVPAALPAPRFLQVGQQMTSSEWGTTMHLALSQLPLAAYDANTLSDALDDLLERAIFTEQERAVLDEAALLRFFQSEVVTRCLAEGIVPQRERAFTLRYKEGNREVFVDGQVDWFYEWQGHLYLLDFKTDRRKEPSRYLLQLAMYCEGVEKALKKPVQTAGLYWVRFGEFTYFSREALQDALQALR